MIPVDPATSRSIEPRLSLLLKGPYPFLELGGSVELRDGLNLQEKGPLQIGLLDFVQQ